MALNYSHRPIFPAHTAEDNLEGFNRSRYMNREIENRASPESMSKDIIDLLPSDPFGMDITTTVTAITGWLEDLEVDYSAFGRRTKEEYDYDLFTDLNLIWNNAIKFQSFPRNNIWVDEKRAGLVPARVEEEEKIGDPHQALDFAVCYLGLKDLLLVERVCKHLYTHIRNDNSLWKCIHIDQPLNEKITDEILIQLTNRAQGNLNCLTLVECQKVTDDGIRRVLDTNPRLTKLCVPGCTRLSIPSIINNIKAFNTKEGNLGIKCLRIGGLYGLTLEHYEELKALLGEGQKGHCNKPRIFHWGNFYLLCDDERVLDVETCPKCEKQKLVYDCSACKKKKECRGCTLCVPRCFECGRCVNDNEYEETFTLDKLCAECFKELPICPEKPEVVEEQEQDVGPE